MGFLSQKIERCQVVVSDHIYTWRAAFTYSHHGIYIGRNKVVHFTLEQTAEPGKISSLAASKNISSSSSHSSTYCDVSNCGFKQPDSGVILSCLNCFLGKGSLYRFEHKISRSSFLTKIRGGTCTTAESDPQTSVIYRAICLLENGFGKYDVFMNNCEDFAIYCKAGIMAIDQKSPGRSGQVASVVGAPLSAIVSSSLFYLLPNPLATLTITGMYLYGRYVIDIGVREDVVKVPVEDMGSFHGWEVKS